MTPEIQIAFEEAAKIDVYQPKTSLNFDKTGKLLLYSNDEYIRMARIVLGMSQTGCAFPVYSFGRAIQRMSIWRMLLWVMPAVIGAAFSVNAYMISSHMISKIWLKSCGTMVVIELGTGLKRVVKITDLGKLETSKEFIRSYFERQMDAELLPV